MSARRLQRPTPISESKYKWLGTSIVTTLATLPQRGDTSIPGTPSEITPHESGEHPVEKPNSLHDTIHKALADTDPSRSGTLNGAESNIQVKLLTEPSDEGACGSDTKSSPPIEAAMKASVDHSPDSFLDVQNILADFNRSHIPDFVRRETWIDRPDVAAVQKILEAHEEGSSVEDLIHQKFPGGDFQYHLIAYFRMRTSVYKRRRLGSLEARLMDAYVTGVKEWCASALDIYISQVERDLSTHEKSSEAADDRQGKRLSLQTPRFYKQAVSEQKKAVDCLVKAAFKRNSKFHEEWREYKREHSLTHDIVPSSLMLAGKSRKILLRKRLYLISWLMRNSSPEFFLYEAGNLARAIRSFGGPCFLINLIQTFGLYPEDVAEYERLNKSVQEVAGTDLPKVLSITMKLPVDLPKTVEYLTYPLSVLSPNQVAATFRRHQLPPFLQVGYGVDNFKTEVINRIIKLHDRGERDRALSVMKQEFLEEQNFHAHLFGLLRTAMRSYALVPKRSKRYKDPKAWYPHDFSTPLGKLLHAYIEGLQWWCADVHDALRRQIDDAIHAAYELSTEENLDVFLDWVRRVEPDYTRRVRSVVKELDLSSMRTTLPLSSTVLNIHPQVMSLRRSLRNLQWVLRHMPWDCFLFLRSNLAAAVKELDRGEKGFSFLARILESLSFTDRDADEFREYCADVGRRHRSR